GHAGGIWALKSRGLPCTFSTFEVHQQAISLQLRYGEEVWMCTRLYVIPLPSTCSKLWDHFKYRNPLIHQPWMLLRDFDEIIYPTEQCGGFFPNARANVFGSMIDVCFLFDVYSISSFFTWQKRCRNNVIISRMLDKCLTSDTWKNMFPNAYVEVLCRMHSNHNPLFLRCDRQENRGVKPFKFEAT
ncbi:hypothetical protein AAZX31_09G059600, partial [Glycine max]